MRVPPVPGDPARLDTGKPSAARVYDVLLGGHDNFPVDRDVARWLRGLVPELPRLCAVNRLFLTAAVTRLASDGMSQFVELGSGLPVSGHVIAGGTVLADVHETARASVPGAAVIYVDHDVMAVSHMAASLGGAAGVAAVNTDLRYPREVMADPRVRLLIDFTRPAAVLLCGTLGFAAAEEAGELIAGYASQVPAGSAVAVTTAWFPPGRAQELEALSGGVWRAHSPENVQEWLDGAGLRPLRDGVADVTRWPMLPARELSAPAVIGAVGVKG